MSLSGRGYSVAKWIPTLIIGACAAADVVATSGFGIFFGITFSKGAPRWKLILCVQVPAGGSDRALQVPAQRAGLQHHAGLGAQPRVRW